MSLVDKYDSYFWPIKEQKNEHKKEVRLSISNHVDIIVAHILVAIRLWQLNRN